MTGRRKTQKERDREWDDARERAWESFRSQLDSVTSLSTADQLLKDAPAPSTPGRSYYTNLAFFLGQRAVPLESNYAERSSYLAFVRRLDANAMEPAERDRIEAMLHAALENDQSH